MEENNATIIFRVDADLKKAFELACKRMDKTASQILRAVVRDVVSMDLKKNGQQSLDLAPKKAAETPAIEIIESSLGASTARKPKKGQRLTTPLKRRPTGD